MHLQKKHSFYYFKDNFNYLIHYKIIKKNMAN